ncbi:MBL fold metallo-hydrolase [candidate division KSB1 bacterium]
MKIRFWGTRGSIPTPGSETVRYGGNTVCVEVRGQDDNLIILDAGTGIRKLGAALMATEFGQGKGKGNLFLSHTHWDHIQGFPFFVPLFFPGNSFTVYGPKVSSSSLEEILSGQMMYTYFPVSLDNLDSEISFKSLEKEAIDLGFASVTTENLNHPGRTFAYRIESGGSILVYSTDTEPYAGVMAGKGRNDGTEEMKDEFDEQVADHIKKLDDQIIEFARGADVLIFDAQFTASEYKQRVGWGHSTPEDALRVAAAAGVKKLFLFHHDPGHADEDIDSILAEIREKSREMSPNLEVDAAAEGLEVEF